MITSKKNLLLFAVLFMSILPITNTSRIGLPSFAMPVLYLFLPLGGVKLILVLSGKLRIPKLVQYITLLFLLIMVGIFISTFHGSAVFGSNFAFPREIIQYVARMLCFMSFAVAFYTKKLSTDVFIKYFLIILNIGMLIGILQWIPWPGRTLFISLYPFRDGVQQMEQLGRELHNIRVHGVAQHATSNGGLAMFFFVFSYSVFKYYKKYQVSSLILMSLSITNIFISQSRAGALGLMSAIILFYIVDVYANRKGFKKT